MEIEELRRIAAQKELSLNYIAKDEMLSKALYYLQGNEDIVLKGGTAINRVYLANKRFSEDIDLDLVIKNTDMKNVLLRTGEIVSKIKEFQIAKSRIMNGTIRYDLFYTNPLNQKDKIRLEFKIVNKTSGYQQKIINFGFVAYQSALLNVYNIEELIQHKIDCILHRVEGKDFFDMYYLIDIEHKTIKTDKNKIIERINFEEKEVKLLGNTLNHYIPRTERPSWYIFLEELKEKIKNKL